MSLNHTPSGERIHIGFFGRRNVGKSSLVNAVTGQDLAVVSETKGTTTDPVSKSMELLPIGPVVIIDTPGFDDEGHLGQLRVKKTREVLGRTDVAVLVAEAGAPLADCEQDLIGLFAERKIPYIIAWNKCDLLPEAQTASDDASAVRNGQPAGGFEAAGSRQEPEAASGSGAAHEIYVSARDLTNIYELKELIGHVGKDEEKEHRLAADLISPGDLVVLVIPIDKAAPKGRLILPQQQVIRDVLDADGIAACVKENELKHYLSTLSTPPALVVTDSQAFEQVNRDTPQEIPLTSFSILMARYKGFLDDAKAAVAAVENLRDGDTVLISEGCTHHRQCDDIGTYKLPKWLKEYTGKDFEIETSSGKGFPEDLTKYALILHCGGCMLNDREITTRMRRAKAQGVPMTNYGVFIAYVKGILQRSLAILS